MKCNYILVSHNNNDVTCFVGDTKDKDKFIECANSKGMELYIHIPLNSKVLESYKQLEKLT